MGEQKRHRGPMSSTPKAIYWKYIVNKRRSWKNMPRDTFVAMLPSLIYNSNHTGSKRSFVVNRLCHDISGRPYDLAHASKFHDDCRNGGFLSFYGGLLLCFMRDPCDLDIAVVEISFSPFSHPQAIWTRF